MYPVFSSPAPNLPFRTLSLTSWELLSCLGGGAPFMGQTDHRGCGQGQTDHREPASAQKALGLGVCFICFLSHL